MEKQIYNIEKREWIDEFGKAEFRFYAIYFYKKYWFWPWLVKRYITHVECGWGDCSNVVTQFKKLEKAQDFIANILCPKNPYDKTVTTKVEAIKCGEISLIK